MKKTNYLTLIVAACVIIPMATFANNFDIGVNGGYSFLSEYHKVGEVSKSYNPKGIQYEVSGHYRFNLIPDVLDSGLGLYYQHSSQKFDYFGKEYSFKRNSLGFDNYFEVISLPIVNPYIRLGLNIYDNLDGDLGISDKKYFHTFFTGLGLSFDLNNNMSVYCEYKYNDGLGNTKNNRSNNFLGGLRYKI